MSSVNYINFPKVTINFPVDNFVKYAKISYIGNTTSTSYTVNLPGKYYGTYTGEGGDLSFNTVYTFTITPYNGADFPGNKQTIAIDTTPKVAGNIATNSTASNTQLQWKWCGNSPFSYVNISRQITAPYTTNYKDVSKNIISTGPYYDIDLSGNTTYIYKITPYTAGDISYSDISNTLTYTSNAQAVSNLNIIYYDTTSIQISFTLPKNSYSSTYYYELNAVYYGNITTQTGTTSPLLITGLSSGLSYRCYILSYLDGLSKSTSTGLNVTLPSISGKETYFYKFNNDILNYASGIGVNDLSFTGSISFQSNIRNGTSRALITLPAYFSLPSFTMSDSGFSICFWFYYLTNNNKVIDFSNNNFYISVSSNKLIYNDLSNTSNSNYFSNFSLTTTFNYHISLVFNPITNTCETYLNNNKTTTYNISYSTLKSKTYITNMFGYNNTTNSAVSAAYSDVRVFNGTVLNNTDITNIFSYYTFNGWIKISGLVCFFPFDNNELNYNKSPLNGTTGLILYGTPLPTYVDNSNTLINNIRKKCISFSGNAQYAVITGLNTQLSTSPGYGIVLWVYSSKTTYIGRMVTLIDNNSTEIVAITLSGTNNKISILINQSTVLTSSIALTLNKWNLVVLSHITGNLRLYINTVQEPNSSTTTQIPTTIIDSMYIGGNINYPNDYVQGYISNVAFYNQINLSYYYTYFYGLGY